MHGSFEACGIQEKYQTESIMVRRKCLYFGSEEANSTLLSYGVLYLKP